MRLKVTDGDYRRKRRNAAQSHKRRLGRHSHLGYRLWNAWNGALPSRKQQTSQINHI
jgi:hypothetical protein